MIIETGFYGIILEVENNSGEILGSDLYQAIAGESNNPVCVSRTNDIVFTIESLILAHACAGIDVKSPAYLEGLETTMDSIANNLF